MTGRVGARGWRAFEEARMAELWYRRSTVPGVGLRVEIWCAPGAARVEGTVRFTWRRDVPGPAHVELSSYARYARPGALILARILDHLEHARIPDPEPHQLIFVLRRMQGAEVFG